MSRTILGPLTTVHTPPAECFTNVISYNGRDEFLGGYGQSCEAIGKDNVMVISTTCYPPALASWAWRTDNLAGLTAAFYSPADKCPEGFVTACSIQKDQELGPPLPAETNGELGELWGVLEDGESYVGCCPSGFECVPGVGEACRIRITGETTFTGKYWNFPCSAYSTESAVSGPMPTPVFLGYRVNLIMPGAAITGDPSASESQSSPSGAAGTSVNGERKLSNQVIAGISVAAVCITAVIAAMLFFIMRLIHRNKKLKEKNAKLGSSLSSPLNTEINELFAPSGSTANGTPTDIGEMQAPHTCHHAICPHQQGPSELPIGPYQFPELEHNPMGTGELPGAYPKAYYMTTTYRR